MNRHNMHICTYRLCSSIHPHTHTTWLNLILLQMQPSSCHLAMCWRVNQLPSSYNRWSSEEHAADSAIPQYRRLVWGPSQLHMTTMKATLYSLQKTCSLIIHSSSPVCTTHWDYAVPVLVQSDDMSTHLYTSKDSPLSAPSCCTRCQHTLSTHDRPHDL